MMQRPNGGSPINPPNAPQKKSGKGRRRPENWQNRNSETEDLTASVPVNPYQRLRKQQAVGGLTQLAANMVRGKFPVPVPVRPVAAPLRPTVNDDLKNGIVNDNLRPENVENLESLNEESLTNRESYFDELVGLLQSYTPGYQRIHQERNGRPFVLPDTRPQEQRDADARRDFRSLLGYIDRVEQDYVIPDSVADFVKSIRKFQYYPERVDERWMNKMAYQIYPLLEDFKIRLGKQTVASLGPAPRRGGGKRQRYTIKKLNRRRRGRTHRHRK
jgi:hypothetical protein